MTLLADLGALESAGLIRLAQLEPELEYLFRHALVQEAAYASLLESDRRRLHRSVGSAVEQIYADRLGEHAGMLAYHFERAADRARALRYGKLAAERALAGYANCEAEQALRRCLTLTDDPAEQAALRTDLGTALERQSRFEEAEQIWDTAVAICRRLGDRNGLAELFALITRCIWLAGETARALQAVEAGLAELADAPESHAVAQLIHEAARANYFSGFPERSAALCAQALAMAERLGAVDVQADTLTTQALLGNQSAEAGLASLQRATALAEAADLTRIGIRANHNLGVVLLSLHGDLPAALQAFQRALALANQMGNARAALYSLAAITSHEMRMGGIPAYRARQAELTRLADDIPDRDAVQLELDGARIVAHILAGDLDTAETEAEALIVAARANGDMQMEVSGLNLLGETLLERRHLWQPVDDERIARLFEAQLAFCARGMGRPYHVNCHFADFEARRGRPDVARRLLETAEAVHDEPHGFWDRPARLQAELAIAAAEMRWAEALALSEELAAIWEQAGNRLAWLPAVETRTTILLRRGEPEDLRQAQALLRTTRAVCRAMELRAHLAWNSDRLEQVRSALFEQAAAHHQSARELAAAARMQQTLLPTAPPQRPGWVLRAALQPVGQTSGDFYDFIELDAENLGIVVADVAGKGAGAAVYMAMSRSYLRAAFDAERHNPTAVVAEVNKRIVSDTSSDMFVTMLCGVLNTTTGAFHYVNAGHNPALLLRAEGNLEQLGLSGVMLGVLRETRWQTAVCELQPDDALVIYTDGVPDALNNAGEQYGFARLQQRVAAQRGRPAADLPDAVLDDVRAFVGDAPPFDDITLLVIGRAP